LLEERKAQPTPARSAADEQLLRKLKHELGNVYDMLNRYASAEVYLVYSHLSGMSHTSIETANAYLEWTGGGIFEIRDEAADPGLWSTWPRPPPAATATGTRPAAVAPSSSPKRPRPVHPCCAPAWPWRHRCWPLKMRRPCLTPPLTPTWLATAPCSVAARIGHVAAAPPAGWRLSRAVARREGHLRRDRRRGLDRTRAPGALRSRRAQRSAITEGLDVLAPQELQIARLAAEGLRNREIG
jgi:hypothetical protein